MNRGFFLLFSSITVSQCVSSGPTYSPEIYSPPAALCTNYKIPVEVTASNVLVFNDAAKWTDNDGLSQFSENRAGRDPTAPPTFLANKTQTVSGDYSIGATFCSPRDKKAKHAKTVILASHGLGFDRS